MARIAGSDGGRTAEAIRRAALRLFARHGFAAVSMRQLAAEVGVNAGTLYLYWANKQALLFALMHDHMRALLTAWAAARPPAGDPPAELEAFVRFHVRFHFGRPDEVFVSYMELRNLEPYNFTVIERLRHDYEHGLRDILERGRASGAFVVDDPHVAAMAIIAMLTGVATWYRRGGRLSQERIEDLYAAMAARSVGCRPAKEEPCLRQA